jgi:hypothetical protein
VFAGGFLLLFAGPFFEAGGFAGAFGVCELGFGSRHRCPLLVPVGVGGRLFFGCAWPCWWWWLAGFGVLLALEFGGQLGKTLSRLLCGAGGLLQHDLECREHRFAFFWLEAGGGLVGFGDRGPGGVAVEAAECAFERDQLVGGHLDAELKHRLAVRRLTLGRCGRGARRWSGALAGA